MDVIGEMGARFRIWGEMVRERRAQVTTADPIELSRAYLRYREEIVRRRAIVEVRGGSGFLDVEWLPRGEATARIAEYALRAWFSRDLTAYPPYPCGQLLNVGEDHREVVEKALTEVGFSLGHSKFIECAVCYPNGSGLHREDMACYAFEDKDALLTVLATALSSGTEVLGGMDNR